MAYRQPDYLIWKPQLGIEEFKRSDYRELYENGCAPKENCAIWHNRICDDTVLDNYLSEVFITSEINGGLGQSSYDSQSLSEDQLMLLPYRVHAFSLRSRKWGASDLTNLGATLTFDDSPAEH